LGGGSFLRGAQISSFLQLLAMERVEMVDKLAMVILGDQHVFITWLLAQLGVLILQTFDSLS
jgi:hypothetical protein